MTDSPLNHPPLWEDDQVCSKDDLVRLRAGFGVQLLEAMKCCDDCQKKAAISIGVMDALMNWVEAGKPSYLKSTFNDETGRFDESL